jgi:hypothetical protein
MNNKAQFTPLISEVMAHYNLSDDEWDCLSSFTKQKLSTVYAKHAAAPAMYEALKGCLRVTQAWKSQAEMYGDTVEIEAAVMEIKRIKAALAQAEGR